MKALHSPSPQFKFPQQAINTALATIISFTCFIRVCQPTIHALVLSILSVILLSTGLLLLENLEERTNLGNVQPPRPTHVLASPAFANHIRNISLMLTTMLAISVVALYSLEPFAVKTGKRELLLAFIEFGRWLIICYLVHRF